MQAQAMEGRDARRTRATSQRPAMECGPAKRKRSGAREGDTSPQPQPPSSGSADVLPLSSSQLRELWDFDNVCGYEIMGAPRRSCSCRDSDEDTQEYPSAVLDVLKAAIREMWNNAKAIFEIFFDPNEPHLGYRMRVRRDLPIKVTLRMEDKFIFGWCAYAPQTGPCSHLYARSPVEPSGYMGGPASFCNWDPQMKSMSLHRPTSSESRCYVRLQCRNLSSGQELLWNYGCQRRQPVDSDWFKQCCVSTGGSGIRRQERKGKLCNFVQKEKCVLCGFQFSAKNKEHRIQRKPHFINSHADYLGSTWNGMGSYRQEEVLSSQVLIQAHLLNGLLQSLTKDLKWIVVPACIVMSDRDNDAFTDSGALLQEFKTRCALLRRLGILVLRGMEDASSIHNLSVDHLKPISKSVWRTLRWKDGVMPIQGMYSACSQGNLTSSDLDADLQALILKFCRINCKQL